MIHFQTDRTTGHMIVELPTPIPPDWCERMQCSSQKRFIAFHWSCAHKRVSWTDGHEQAISAKSASDSWHAFMRHSSVENFLCHQKANLGSNEDQAIHWLLFDTVNRKAYIATPNLIRKVFLSKQNRETNQGTTKVSIRQSPPSQMQSADTDQYYG